MSDDFAENDPAWIEACRREEVVRDLLRRYPDRLTVSAVEDVAWELALSRITIYRLIKRYRAARTVAAHGITELLTDGAGFTVPVGATVGVFPGGNIMRPSIPWGCYGSAWSRWTRRAG